MISSSDSHAGQAPAAIRRPGARSVGFWQDAWRRFRRNRLGTAALVFIGIAAVCAILAPAIAGTRPIVCRYKGQLYFPALEYVYEGGENAIFLRDGFRGVFPTGLARKDPDSWAIWPLIYKDPYRYIESGEWPGDPGDEDRAPPSLRNFFGTDDQRRDVFARVLYGTRIALAVGVFSMGIAGGIGIVLGALAGYLGGKVDLVVSRAIEVLMSIPTLVLILAMLSIVQRPGLFHIMAVIGFTRWDSVARYARAEFLRLKTSDFVTAARALGAPWYRIVFRHILPNALAPVLVPITFGIANAILIESALSFLGISGSRGAPSWGRILDTWQTNKECWWLAVFPGLAVFLTVLAYNLAGDAFQESTDPRLRS